MLKTIILLEKLIPEWLKISDGKVDRFGVNDSKKIAKKSEKLCKSQKLAKSGNKLLKVEIYPILAL